LAESLGLDVARLLRQAGVARTALRDPDALIAYKTKNELLERAAAAAGCADFGLRLAKHQGVGILGPLAVMIEHAATTADAAQMASRYIYVHSTAIRLELRPVPGPGPGGWVDLGFDIDAGETFDAAQSYDLALGVVVNALRLLAQGAVEPVLILLPHPPLVAPSVYERALKAPCRFDQPRAAVRLHRADVDKPLPRDNPMMRKLAQLYLDTNFSAPAQALSDRVRLLVRQSLAAGSASHAAVAKMLALHPRTMQRRLDEEGSSFEQIKDEVRREMFRALVERADAPTFASLSFMLGYAEPSALSRSCRRWFGASPTALREQSRAATGSQAVPSRRASSGRAARAVA
jgi:AraC-like DNA-binding protein